MSIHRLQKVGLFSAGLSAPFILCFFGSLLFNLALEGSSSASEKANDALESSLLPIEAGVFIGIAGFFLLLGMLMYSVGSYHNGGFCQEQQLPLLAYPVTARAMTDDATTGGVSSSQSTIN